MVDSNTLLCPNIIYRKIEPSDLENLEKLHGDLFPIRYEPDFFHDVVNSRGIVSWVAVDRRRPGGHDDELIGFVTARAVAADESEIGSVIRCQSSNRDGTLMYILTLGVVKSYRKQGIASSLVRQVINYATNTPVCQGVYLHVLACNNPAICFYKKMGFKCIRRLANFYYINGKHLDAYLFLCYVNGCCSSPCSPLSDLVVALATQVGSILKSMTAKIWKNVEIKSTKWTKYEEHSFHIICQNNKRKHAVEKGGYQCV